MTKQDLKNELDRLGVKYHHMHGEAKLQELLDIATKREKAIVENIEGTTRPTIEEMTDGAVRTDEGAIRPSGILIPNQILAGYRKTTYTYDAICDSSHCEVFKMDHRGIKQFIRMYNVDDHGDKFQDLAKQFVSKMNK